MNAQPQALHATYAPSSAKRWTVCTASAEGIAISRAELNLTDGEDEAGTEAHSELERVLSGEEPNPDHVAAHAVALTVSFVEQLPPGKTWVEQRVALTDHIWGRLDFGHWHAESATVTIVDLKNGYVGVDPNTEQLKIYAAALIRMYDLPAKWIRLVVVQPNDFRPVPRVKQHVMSAAELSEFADRVAKIPHLLPWEPGEAQNGAVGPERKRFVAGEQCTYCPLFGRCDATRDILRDVSALVAGLMTPDQVSPAQRALFLHCKKPIADAFTHAEKAWAKSVMSGAVTPGLKIVESQKHRAWSNPVEARAAVIGQLGVAGLDLPTPAQAIERGLDEATVHKMAPRPPGAPVLAFASDKRPEWKAKTVSEMFGAAVRGET